MPSLDSIETRLKSIRAELTARTKAVAQDFAQGRSADSEELATEQENAETLSALDDEAREEIAQVDRALAQLAAGRYGLCESCGEKIEAGRLEAIPFATQCINCA